MNKVRGELGNLELANNRKRGPPTTNLLYRKDLSQPNVIHPPLLCRSNEQMENERQTRLIDIHFQDYSVSF